MDASKVIWFDTHYLKDYKDDPEQVYLSHSYLKTFIGDKSIYNIEPINEEYFNKYIKNRNFCCREQWLIIHKGLIFSNNQNINHNLKLVEEILFTHVHKEFRKLESEFKFTNTDLLVWNDFKYKIAVNGAYLQFTFDKHFKKYLLHTDDKLIVYSNRSDSEWGIGCNYNDLVINNFTYTGQNLYGLVLMEVRNIIKSKI